MGIIEKVNTAIILEGSRCIGKQTAILLVKKVNVVVYSTSESQTNSIATEIIETIEKEQIL